MVRISKTNVGVLYIGRYDLGMRNLFLFNRFFLPVRCLTYFELYGGNVVYTIGKHTYCYLVHITRSIICQRIDCAITCLWGRNQVLVSW